MIKTDPFIKQLVKMYTIHGKRLFILRKPFVIKETYIEGDRVKEIVYVTDYGDQIILLRMSYEFFESAKTNKDEYNSLVNLLRETIKQIK